MHCEPTYLWPKVGEIQLGTSRLVTAIQPAPTSLPAIGSPQVFFGVILLPFPMLSQGLPPLGSMEIDLGDQLEAFFLGFLPCLILSHGNCA